ncbi:MAG: hypothetical protein DWQ05_20135 [Calditrichaeota bacterium]|nr:MAG: hypothetical protein DWQ05_20135 [Calditrichota bacterium]
MVVQELEVLVQAIVITNDEQVLTVCSQIAGKAEIDWSVERDMADLLLRLHNDDFKLILFDWEKYEDDCLKWLEHIHKLRPRIPIITTCPCISREKGACLMDLGIFYITQKPLSTFPLLEIIHNIKKKSLEAM